MGQVRTWVLYELRGATRAECFFILHWGHNALLLAQQLVLLAPCILRLLTPLLLLHALDCPLLPELCQTLLSSSQHSSPDSLFLSSPALSVTAALTL
ncbi:hypothetical protein NQZ68_020519 [Dissostichus eleginoides]|nr:hypothetical protein NQZ68_020519 [Dissostichus eleginoides]